MGKIKSKFPIGSFFLKMSDEGHGVIHIRYFINGRYVSRSTGMKIESKMWDSKGQKIKGSTNPRINNISSPSLLLFCCQLIKHKKGIETVHRKWLE